MKLPARRGQEDEAIVARLVAPRGRQFHGAGMDADRPGSRPWLRRHAVRDSARYARLLGDALLARRRANDAARPTASVARAASDVRRPIR